MTMPTCNLNCVCIDSDCSYKHYITYKERKIVKNFYDAISTKSKDEPNPEMRKKNCTFGQLCEKENCGFRHRLSFYYREKLIVSYRFNKICPASNDKKIIAKSSIKETIKPSNLFMSLEDIDDDIIENTEDKKEEIIINHPTNDKSWCDVVRSIVVPDIQQKITLSLETSRWEDLDDEDFYMKF